VCARAPLSPFLQVNVAVGLDEAQVSAQRIKFGFNELVDNQVHPCIKFLGYFWGPMPIMIWAAVLIELIKSSISGEGWEDFGVLLALQLINGVVGFVEEHNAGNAIAALKKKLAPQCMVVRTVGGSVSKTRIASRDLVPGDVVELSIGDVVPADCVIRLGMTSSMLGHLQVDQSALTGESLPVNMGDGDNLKMSSVVKQGFATAVVTATGKNTFYGKAAALMNIKDSTGRFQKVLFKVTLGLLTLSLILCSIIFGVFVANGASTAPHLGEAGASNVVLRALSLVIVLLVASIPIAMQVVFTSTMAVGSNALAKQKVIVARLSAIEELAGMSVLCSDKTGTLTKNELTLKPPTVFNTSISEEQLLFHAALATNREATEMDAIDHVIYHAVGSEPVDGDSRWTKKHLDSFAVESFIPFNPIIKRTEARVLSAEGEALIATKGAPQIVVRMCNDTLDAAVKELIEAKVQEYADRGLRTLGVATGIEDAVSGTVVWTFDGLLSLFDPPRDDTASTIKAARGLGVEVKMITGDQRAIAVETCRQLELGTDVFTTEVLNSSALTEGEKSDRIFVANGFAEVMPEDKFNIVQGLRSRGVVTGMTGDGVNDAPALKRADIGIAVQGATDAAKAAADIVLIEPGLSVIIDAIKRSRKIFQRMRNYAIYRIACTLQLLLFFFFAIVTIDPTSNSFFGDARVESGSLPCPSNGQPAASSSVEPPAGLATTDQWWCAHEAAFVLPVISLVIITILNDGTIITISHDNVSAPGSPQKWRLWEIVIIATVLGLIACLSSMLLLVFALQANPYQYRLIGSTSFFGNLLGDSQNHYVTWGQAQTIMYLKVSLSDFLTIFAARTRFFFWERPPGKALAVAGIVAVTVSTILANFWPIGLDGININTAYERGGYHMIMSPLTNNPYAVITVWVYCILWFFVQDIFKVIAYHVFIHPHTQHPATEQRMEVARSITSNDEVIARERRTRQGSQGGATTDLDIVMARMQVLESEMRKLKRILVARGISIDETTSSPRAATTPVE
jgi:H+-transporting ATPase